MYRLIGLVLLRYILTLVVVEGIYVLASVKKLKILEQVKESSHKLEITLLEKNKEQTDANFAKIVTAMKQSFDGKNFGYTKGDQVKGSFGPSWEQGNG